MNHKEDNIEFYLKQYPKLKKWINECSVCHAKGYKPEMPETIGGEGSVAAQNLRRYLLPMHINELGLCTQCSRCFDQK